MEVGLITPDRAVSPFLRFTGRRTRMRVSEVCGVGLRPVRHAALLHLPGGLHARRPVLSRPGRGLRGQRPVPPAARRAPRRRSSTDRPRASGRAAVRSAGAGRGVRVAAARPAAPSRAVAARDHRDARALAGAPGGHREPRQRRPALEARPRRLVAAAQAGRSSPGRRVELPVEREITVRLRPSGRGRRLLCTAPALGRRAGSWSSGRRPGREPERGAAVRDRCGSRAEVSRPACAAQGRARAPIGSTCPSR